jgi:choline dehydrogenase-like flavoprotein
VIGLRRVSRAVRWRAARIWWRLRPTGRLADPRALVGRVFDVCIVGSGPAGAVLALDLATRGRAVLLLEAGPARPRAWLAGPRATARCSGPVDYPIAHTRYRGLGGTSNLWTGGCPRLHPLDLGPNAYTPFDGGWPIAYGELEPYYAPAERTLGVRGGRADLPAPDVPDATTLRTALRGVGVCAADPPISTGLWGGDHFRVTRDLLPRLAPHPRVTLVAGHAVTRLVPDGTGRIERAEIADAGGRRRLVRAETYVVAAGGLETPRVLLLSRGPSHPAGIANGHGRVGRGFMDHLKVGFRGHVRDRRLAGSGRSEQFYEDFKRRGLGSIILGFAAESRGRRPALRISADIETHPSPDNRVTLAPDLVDDLGDPGLDLSVNLGTRDLRTLDATRELIRRIYADLGAEAVTELPPEHGRVGWLSHHMGTCRMGDDPGTSVVDRHLRVHESPNLYVLGSAVFVTGGAANPTLTIVALAHRLADHLGGR